MQDKTPIINAYIGPSGSGKTFKALLDIAKYDRQIRLDAQPLGQEGLQGGCDVVRTVYELFDYVSAHKGKPFKVCFWPRGVDLKTAFHWACKIAITYRNIAILADEANRYIDRHLCEAGKAVFFQSRHSQTRLFYTMFNPRHVNPEMRANTSKTHIFKNLHKNVTDYLRECGAAPETMAKFEADNLPKYSYALIETGKRPVIVSPKPPKKRAPKPASPKASGGRRGKQAKKRA